VGVPRELFKYLLPVVAFYCIGDYVTTLIGLQFGCIELNPVMSGIVTDPIAFAFIKLSIVLLLCLFYWQNMAWKYRRVPFVVISAIGGIVTFSNSCFILFELYA
jgi:hypothetical protein